MLVFDLPEEEQYNNKTNEFCYLPEIKNLQFEHSLLSLSKWEMHYHKPFLSEKEKTAEETIYYLKCMCINGDKYGIEVFERIARNPKLIRELHDYIENPMTATTIREDPNQKKNHDVITSEIIYYDMIALQIPIEFEKWHLNRLMMLIRVCSIKNEPPKKMSKHEIYARNAAMNAERQARMKTKG